MTKETCIEKDLDKEIIRDESESGNNKKEYRYVKNKKRIRSLFISKSLMYRIGLKDYYSRELLYEYEIDDRGEVSVLENIDLTEIEQHNKKTTNLVNKGHLRIKFKRADGTFNLNGINLTTLEGCPEEVGRNFIYNEGTKYLKSLKGCPRIINGNCSIQGCSVESLEGLPEHIKGKFIFYNRGKKFSESDIRKVCKVDRQIIIKNRLDLSYNYFSNIHIIPDKKDRIQTPTGEWIEVEHERKKLNVLGGPIILR